MLGLFAAELHISLKAEPVFHIGTFTITNSMLYGAICSLALLILFVVAARRISVQVAKGWSQAIDWLVDFVMNLLEGPLGSRKNVVKYAPFFATYFIFILFSNALELVPWVGDGLTVKIGGNSAPLFRPFTADLNGTLAMAITAIIAVQVLSIRAQGGRGHLRHYFSDKPLNPINFFIGLLEVFGEFTRVISLSLRLFLNTAVGEILISVFTSMIAAQGRTPVAVIPIFMFEMLVAGIQAYVFTLLAATYLGISIAHADEHHEADHHKSDHAPVEAGSRDG